MATRTANTAPAACTACDGEGILLETVCDGRRPCGEDECYCDETRVVACDRCEDEVRGAA